MHLRKKVFLLVNNKAEDNSSKTDQKVQVHAHQERILLALEHLHSNCTHHRDLKLCNIFIIKNEIRLGNLLLEKLLDG